MLHHLVTCLSVIMLGGVIGTATAAPARQDNEATAVFAMGCFWCGESEFRNRDTHEPLPGITSIRVGYAGGTQAAPTYEHHEGYKESVKITYLPSKISYEQLLAIFWKNVDPLDAHGQFCDKGYAYTSVIFYQGNAQMTQALSSKDAITAKLGHNETQVLPYTTFYDAEEYHQNYATKNPIRYHYYRWSCGRDQRLNVLWGKHDA